MSQCDDEAVPRFIARILPSDCVSRCSGAWAGDTEKKTFPPVPNVGSRQPADPEHVWPMAVRANIVSKMNIETIGLVIDLFPSVSLEHQLSVFDDGLAVHGNGGVGQGEAGTANGIQSTAVWPVVAEADRDQPGPYWYAESLSYRFQQCAGPD